MGVPFYLCPSSFAIVLALSSRCPVTVSGLFSSWRRGLGLQCINVVFPDHTHLFFMLSGKSFIKSDKTIGPRIDRRDTTDNTGTGSASWSSKTPSQGRKTSISNFKLA